MRGLGTRGLTTTGPLHALLCFATEMYGLEYAVSPRLTHVFLRVRRVRQGGMEETPAGSMRAVTACTSRCGSIRSQQRT
ncbi:hypothetical protein Naga_100406g6 [Nannochloropsis gaditana]|uniref:Uncharacterized protein n=1 Tax=Nannochloropsis gaditana TaxID=72520 RepID=W7SZP3_9STRA|nr:hypothetical protein Naga_100406g6 [Nannochloropsis gaditana]